MKTVEILSKFLVIARELFFKIYVARRGAHLAAERSPSAARADGARRSVAVPNGEGVASGSATIIYLYHRCIYIINANTNEE